MTLKPPMEDLLTFSEHIDDLSLNLGHYCHGNSTSEDANGFQAALDDLPTEGGRLTSPPGKVYRISTPLTCTGKADLQIDMNGSWIESRIPSGSLLTIKGAHRSHFERFRIRLMSGAPSSFIAIPSGGVNAEYSWWVTLHEPVFWSHINIPANLDCIVVDDDNYWCEVVRPYSRILSGTLTGRFRRVVSFLSQSNAGKVIGGSLNNADTGVYVDSCNSTEVDGTAFESCDRAVDLSDAVGGTPCGGTSVHNLRVENCPIVVDLSDHSARTTFYAPISVGDIAYQDGESTRAHEIWNPNNVPIVQKTGERIRIRSSWGNMPPQITIQAGTSQGQLPVFEVEQRDSTAFWTTLTSDLFIADVTASVADTSTFAATGTLRLIGTEADGTGTYEDITYTGKTATSFTGLTRARGGTTAFDHETGVVVRDALNRVFSIDGTGSLMHRSSSAATPVSSTECFMVHHRAFITKLISYRPDNTGANLRLCVTDGAATPVDVLSAFQASVRPGATNTIDLGVTGTRWRNLFLSGSLDHSGASVGFYGTAPIAKPTGVAVTAAGVHAALVSLGLIAA